MKKSTAKITMHDVGEGNTIKYDFGITTDDLDNSQWQYDNWVVVDDIRFDVFMHRNSGAMFATIALNQWLDSDKRCEELLSHPVSEIE